MTTHDKDEIIGKLTAYRPASLSPTQWLQIIEEIAAIILQFLQPPTPTPTPTPTPSLKDQIVAHLLSLKVGDISTLTPTQWLQIIEEVAAIILQFLQPPAPTPTPTPAKRPTGAKPSPRHKLAAAHPFRPGAAVIPDTWVAIPAFLEMWLNDTYGDCHDSATEVLTEHGWTPWPDYDGKSLLGTMNPTTKHLEFQAPLAVIRREHDGPMAFSSHQGVDFAITPNHRFFLERYRIPSPYVPGGAHYDPVGEFCTAKNLPTRFRIPGTTSGFTGTNLKKLGIGQRTWNGTDLLRLLALVLSDGWVDGKNAHHQDRVSFCCFREDRYDLVAGFAKQIGVQEQPNRKGVWLFTDAALADWIKANAFVGNDYHSPSKMVPDLVKVADQDQIGEFLRFFGDQTIHDAGNRHFYSSSKRMIDDIQELLLRVGKRGTIYDRGIRSGGVNSRGVKIEGRVPAYELYEYQDGEYLGFQRTSRNPCIKFDSYKGEVFCATVPNSTLVTRRNGTVLVSGNCVSAEECASKAAWHCWPGVNYPELEISDTVLKAWCKSNGVLNGADLSQVMDMMIQQGITGPDGKLYHDGPYQSVDYTNDAVLRAAIAQGPVKIGIASSQLQGVVGSSNGWVAVGFRNDNNEDHCTALWGWGTLAQLCAAFKVSVPSGANASSPAYALYTWSTIGIIDQPSLLAICGEAWLRTPVTPEQPAVAPTPTPTPIPTPSSVVSVDFGAKTLTGQGWTANPAAGVAGVHLHATANGGFGNTPLGWTAKSS